MSASLPNVADARTLVNWSFAFFSTKVILWVKLSRSTLAVLKSVWVLSSFSSVATVCAFQKLFCFSRSVNWSSTSCAIPCAFILSSSSCDCNNLFFSNSRAQSRVESTSLAWLFSCALCASWSSTLTFLKSYVSCSYNPDLSFNLVWTSVTCALSNVLTESVTVSASAALVQAVSKRSFKSVTVFFNCSSSILSLSIVTCNCSPSTLSLPMVACDCSPSTLSLSIVACKHSSSILNLSMVACKCPSSILSLSIVICKLFTSISFSSSNISRRPFWMFVSFSKASRALANATSKSMTRRLSIPIWVVRSKFLLRTSRRTLVNPTGSLPSSSGRNLFLDDVETSPKSNGSSAEDTAADTSNPKGGNVIPA